MPFTALSHIFPDPQVKGVPKWISKGKNFPASIINRTPKNDDTNKGGRLLMTLESIVNEDIEIIKTKEMRFFAILLIMISIFSCGAIILLLKCQKKLKSNSYDQIP